MQHELIANILNSENGRNDVKACGWIRTRRDSRDFSFVEINDGSCLANLQCLVNHDTKAYSDLGAANTGAAVEIKGRLVPSLGKGQKWEIQADAVKVFGIADQQTYPLQKKRHSDEFLRSIAHLRPRTNKYGSVFRIRSEAAFAIHDFFRSNNFVLVQTPIITGSDCEGAGEMFRVTALGQNAKKDDPDFFNKPASLTVSGQLEAEALAAGLGRVYTFGPTFRAENSNTPRHAAEFWMVEPEMCFADIHDLMFYAETLVRYVVTHVLEKCGPDLELFNRFVDKELLERLEKTKSEPFERISYTDAIKLLESAKADFVYPVSFGTDLQTEHERYLAETYFKRPVIVYDYPKEIKAFYMRSNGDMKTVAAMDLLVPKIGELIGGSQREERLETLMEKLEKINASLDDYWWYLDLRKYGTVPHAGFGLGFERLIMMLTGITNIRDVIPFARTPGSLEF